MEQTLTIRLGTVDDVPVIVHHRWAMFADMGYDDLAFLDAMSKEFAPWVTEKLECGEYLGWCAVNEQNEVVAGAGVWFIEWPPTMHDLTGKRAYLLNVYTEPEYRRLGLARQLVAAILDHCRQQGIQVASLHASDKGRSLYESLGFKQTNEMRLMF
jgi:ribosomal protein S18 acetylase RimI-like enzyme